MKEISLPEPFFSLPNFGFTDELSDFILDTKFYEEAITQRDGNLHLQTITKDSVNRDTLRRYKQICQYHPTNESKDILTALNPAAIAFDDPFSLLVNNIEELKRILLSVYQVGYASYTQSKNAGALWFPQAWCGPSSRACTISLWNHGFFNACYAVYYKQKGRISHGYVILPFVMQEPSFRGSILLDPTSDQTGRYKGHIHRNLVAIKKGTRWRYKTDYVNQKNLFPHYVLNIGTLTQPHMVDPLGILSSDVSMYFHGATKFLKKALSNPVRLEVTERLFE